MSKNKTRTDADPFPRAILYETCPTHISLIKAGDVVEHMGELRTVGKGDLKLSGFLGDTLWGDSYRFGTVPVLKVAVFHARCHLD